MGRLKSRDMVSDHDNDFLHSLGLTNSSGLLLGHSLPWNSKFHPSSWNLFCSVLFGRNVNRANHRLLSEIAS